MPLVGRPVLLIFKGRYAIIFLIGYLLMPVWLITSLLLIPALLVFLLFHKICEWLIGKEKFDNLSKPGWFILGMVVLTLIASSIVYIEMFSSPRISALILGVMRSIANQVLSQT